MKVKRPALVSILALIISLIVANCCIYKSVEEYKLINRKLILQNDSLHAIIIDLNRKLKAAESSGANSETKED